MGALERVGYHYVGNYIKQLVALMRRRMRTNKGTRVALLLAAFVK